jgi:hypothetical protein
MVRIYGNHFNDSYFNRSRLRNQRGRMDWIPMQYSFTAVNDSGNTRFKP